MLDGFCRVDVFPSPKFQFHVDTPEVDRSVKSVGTPMHTGLELKFAITGTVVTVAESVIVSGQLLPDIAISVTVNVPPAENTWHGFCKVEVLFAPDAGSPKFQLHPLIVPVGMVERSVKQVALFKQTVVEENPASGRGFTVTF